MDRVAFLMENTPGMLLECLLNPERLVLHRDSGVGDVHSTNGILAGYGMDNSPIIFQGGGTTELELYLLFDINMQSGVRTLKDVRQLTKPLWDLTKISQSGLTEPPVARFIWGKSWNIPGVVISLSENLDQFTSEGVPQRSWLSMRFREIDLQGKTNAQKGLSLTEYKPPSFSENEPAFKHLLSSSNSLRKDDYTTLNAYDLRLQKTLSDTGLVGEINKSLGYSDSLIGSLWDSLRSTPLAQSIGNVFENAKKFIGDLQNSTGSWLIRGFSQVETILVDLSEKALEVAGTLPEPTKERVRKALSLVREQALKVSKVALDIFSKTKDTTLNIFRQGAYSVGKAIELVKTIHYSSQSKGSTKSSDLVNSIVSGLISVLTSSQQLISKGGDWLLDRINDVLGKLPQLIFFAEREGERRVVRLATLALEKALDASFHFKKFSAHLESYRHHSLTTGIMKCISNMQELLKLDSSKSENIDLARHQLPKLSFLAGQVQKSIEKAQLVEDINSLEALSFDKKTDLDECTSLLREMKKTAEAIHEKQTQSDDLSLIGVVNTVLDKNQVTHTLDSNKATSSERLDQLSFRYYRNSTLWRRLADANSILDPLRLQPNSILKVPRIKSAQ